VARRVDGKPWSVAGRPLPARRRTQLVPERLESSAFHSLSTPAVLDTDPITYARHPARDQRLVRRGATFLLRESPAPPLRSTPAVPCPHGATRQPVPL
jgi:hypothetical protein